MSPLQQLRKNINHYQHVLHTAYDLVNHHYSQEMISRYFPNEPLLQLALEGRFTDEVAEKAVDWMWTYIAKFFKMLYIHGDTPYWAES